MYYANTKYIYLLYFVDRNNCTITTSFKRTQAISQQSFKMIQKSVSVQTVFEN